MSNIEKRRFGQYELRQVLGRGGMATVFRAYQPSLDREVAIKVMSNQFVDDATFIQRFKREARSIANLHHPNILSVYDTGEENGIPFIVTELIEGKTLRERMGKPMDLKLTSRILAQLASALDYAHEHGIVHRDVKPSNVLIGHNDRVVLSDFGIVKLLQDQTANLTATGFGVGTPEYMSPEQGSGEPIDGRSDLYSLGIILYEMLTAVTPFRGETPLAIIMGHIQQPLPDPRKYNPDLSPQLIAVLTKALAKKPEDRFQTGAAFAEAFDQAVRETLNPSIQTFNSDKTQVASSPLVIQGQSTLAMSASDSRIKQPTLTPPEAYMMALGQEQRGNYQAAYETLFDVQQHEPGYRDVPARLQRYEQSQYQYTGQHSLYAVSNTGQTQIASPTSSNFNSAVTNIANNETYIPPVHSHFATGTLTPPPVSNPGYSQGSNQAGYPVTPPPPSYGYTPPPPPPYDPNNKKKSKSGLFLALAGGVIAVVVVIVVVLLVVLGGAKNNPTPTATVVAVAITATPNPTTVTSSTTTNLTTVGATPVPTTQATTAVPATTAPLVTTVAFTPTSYPTTAPATVTTQAPSNSATSQVQAITTKLYGPDGDLASSVKQLKDLVKKYPDSALAELELGQALYLWNHEAGELDALQNATKLEPKNVRAWAVLALAYRDNYQLPKALDAGSRAIELDPNSADAHAAYALALVQTEDIDRAKTQISTALKLDPAGMWTLWSAFGVDLVTGDDESGIAYIDQLIKRYPKMATFTSAKGDYYSQIPKYDDAITWYKKAITIDPGYAFAHSGLGWAYHNKGDNETARKEFQSAISENDNYAYAHDGLGFVLDNDGNYDDAIKQFNRAIISDPGDALAYNGLATAYISKGIDTKDATTANALYNQGITAAKSAVQYNPSYADAYFHIGQGYYQLKQYPQAEAQFKLAISHNSADDIAIYHDFLAYTYYYENKLADAKSEVSKTLKIDPANQDAIQLQSKLGK